MNKNLTWRELKALNDLYNNGQTKAKVQAHPYIKFIHKEKGLVEHKFSNTNVLVAAENYPEFYEADFLESFFEFQRFFENHSFLTNQTSFKERDIRVLMLISRQKQEVLNNQFSRKKLSSVFFDDSKYIRKKSALEKAILNILEISSFQGSEKDTQQYRLVLDCKTPKLIVLCENIDFLLYPSIARSHNVWLWYVGGNNIKKLEHLPPIEMPIYYSCDWDYHGLKIYEGIKDKISEIKLLFPEATGLRKQIETVSHKSDWNYNKPFSGLSTSASVYDTRCKALIEELIASQHWIEEESNDLIRMLEINEAL